MGDLGAGLGSGEAHHAGIAKQVEQLDRAASGANATEAQAAAYAAVEAIAFPSGFFRSDIGWKEVAREAKG